MANNPKSYYNQPDFSGENSVVHKPNEISANDFLSPPPPYSPKTASSSTPNSQYNETRESFDEPQEQVGLLSQPRRSINPHLDLNEPTNFRDPGCCRFWCKYIFLLLLVSFIFYKLTDSFGKHSPENSVCPRASQSLTKSFEFYKNIVLIMEGTVTEGQVTVVPLFENRHEGTFDQTIQIYPENLQVDFEVTNLNDDTTQVLVRFPSVLDQDACIYVNVNIRVPYAAELIRLDVKNVDILVHPFKDKLKTLDIKNSNGDLVLNDWSGESIQLITSQGQLKTGSLTSGNSVYLENSNGLLQTNIIEAKKTIVIKNSNGAVDILGRLEADDSINVESSNELMQLMNLISNHVIVKNSNGEIRVDDVQVKDGLIIESANEPIAVAVSGEKNTKVDIMTANAPIQLQMTREFEGRFVMSTSQGKINIRDDQDALQYEDNTRHLKRGVRKGYGNKGYLTVQTSNADVNVSFDL